MLCAAILEKASRVTCYKAQRDERRARHLGGDDARPRRHRTQLRRYAVAVDATPEAAVQAAMVRAVQKYGSDLDFTAWQMRTEWGVPGSKPGAPTQRVQSGVHD